MNVSPGWYPDPATPQQSQRYWDGTQWTPQTRPLNTLADAQNAAPQMPSHPPQPFDAAKKPAGNFWTRLTTVQKRLAIGGVAVLLLIGGLSSALSKDDKTTTVKVDAATVSANASSAAAVASASASSALASAKSDLDKELASQSASVSSSASATPTASETPTPTPADPLYFKTTANKQLDDMDKDLDDLAKRIAEGATLRTLGNLAELSFNAGQLDGIQPVEAIAADYTAKVEAIGHTVEAMTTAGGDQNYTEVTAKSGDLRNQVADLRQLVNTVQ